MKKIIILTLTIILCLGLTACGSDTEKATDNDTKKDNVATDAATDAPSTDTTIPPISIPDLNLDNFTEEKAIFKRETEEENQEVEVYYKDDIIQSITFKAQMAANGHTKDELNQLKDETDAFFAEISKKDFVSYSCIVTDESISLVMACNDLEVKENLKDVSDMGLFEGLTENTTYTQLLKILEDEGFKKQ